MSDSLRDQFRELTNMVAEDGKGRQMSDTRKEIAERHAREWLARWGSAPPNAAIKSAMSEYAAAVLEEVANAWKDCHCQWESDAPCKACVIVKQLRARATQERER